MFYSIAFCVVLFASASLAKNLDAQAKSNVTRESLPTGDSADAAFVQKVVELKKQALRLMALRHKKVDPQGNVTEDASWDDLQLTEDLYNAMKKNFDEEEKRLTSTDNTDRMTAPNFNLIPNSKWPPGPIQYTTFLMKSADKLDMIEQAIHEISSKTCIQFNHVESASGPHLQFQEVNKPSVCADSPLGMRPDKNLINIDFGCKVAMSYCHEILHSLGFAHTQERPDADQYIQLDEDNIIEAFRPFFKPWAYAMTDQGPFDYGSIMQYNRFAFAIDKSRPTMEPKVDPEVNGPLMGQRKALSPEDVRLLNKVYCEDPDPDKNANCIDKNASCAFWAQNGKCDNDAYVKQNCNYSCKQC